MPLYRGEPDNIVGVVHAKDLFRAVNAAGRPSRRQDRRRHDPALVHSRSPRSCSTSCRRSAPATSISPSWSTSTARCAASSRSRTSSRRSSATSRTSTTPSSAASCTREDGSLICRGDVPIHDLNREFGWQLPEDVAITIAGLVLHEARRIPEVGQTYAFYGFRFEILKREGTRIAELRIIPPAAIQAARLDRHQPNHREGCHAAFAASRATAPAHASRHLPGLFPRRRPVGHRGPHHRREDLRACQRMARAAEARRLRARHVDPRSRSTTRFSIVDVEAATDKSPYRDLRRRRAGLQEADRLADRRRLPPRGARPAGRRAGLHAHRRAARPGGHDGLPDVSSGKARELNRAWRKRWATSRTRSPGRKGKPYVIDSCHAWASDGPVVRRWAPRLLHRPRCRSVRGRGEAGQGNRDSTG